MRTGSPRRRRRRYALLPLAAVLMLLASAATARADDAIGIGISADPVESLPATVTASGTTEDAEAFVSLTAKPATAGSCAATPTDDSGSSVIRNQSVDLGRYSVTGDATFGTAQTYLLCSWLTEDDGSVLARNSAMVTARQPTLSLTLTAPRQVRPGQGFSFAVATLAQATRQLYLYVIHDAGRGCPADAGAISDPVDQIEYSRDIDGGPLTLTEDATVPDAGHYLICGWLEYDGPDGLQPEAAASAPLTVAKFRPRPAPLPHPKTRLGQLLHVTFYWQWSNRSTRLLRLKLPRRLPAALHVVISCHGPGCSRHHRVQAHGRRAVRRALLRLVGQRWRARSRLQLTFTCRHYRPFAAEARFRANKAPVMRVVRLRH